MERLLLNALPAVRPIHHQSDWRMTCKKKQNTTTKTNNNNNNKNCTRHTKSPCKMAGRYGDTTGHHFPPCTACNHSPPFSQYTRTHTNNSLTLTSLPDGDSAAKIRKTLPTKDNSNVITEKKAAHAGWRAAGVRVQDGIYILLSQEMGDTEG